MVSKQISIAFSSGLALLALLALSGLASRAWADEGEAPADPPAPDEAPAPVPEDPQPSPWSGPGVTQLPGIEVQAPRIWSREDVTETPLRMPMEDFDTPAAVTVQDRFELQDRRMIRSVPDALLRLPGVMVQKTAPLQSSPFIRGFTGYGNLMLIDGIRLNNAAFRSGPLQYWSTIDPYIIDSLELARGPFSVLYGSDGIGGVVNVRTWRRESFCRGFHVDGALMSRGATAENAVFARGQFEGNYNKLGWAGGITGKYFGEIIAGEGRLPGTGYPTELSGDLRLDYKMNRDTTITFAWQHTEQKGAPRTERTVDAKSFAGTAIGSELRRDYDQRRDLVYARVDYAPNPCYTPVSRAQATVSYHYHEELRDRLRSGDRQDISGFSLGQLGITALAEMPTSVGRFTYGFDYYHDTADTYREDFTGGVSSGRAIQGPFGDDASYDLLGLYVQDVITVGRWEIVPGLRFTYARAKAGRVEDPATGDIIAVQNDWTRITGSLRVLYHINDCWNVYGSAGQAFRAPTLYDLTAFEETSSVELPAPDLDAEDYYAFEVGVKTRHKNFSGYLAGYYTILDGTIVRSPTGELLGTTPVARKDNIGDGYIAGVEAEAAWRFERDWMLFGNISWLQGDVDQIDPDTDAIERLPISRNKPLTSLLAIRYEPPKGCFWGQFEWAWADTADRLSLRDMSDTRRIPPDGTPGWNHLNLRFGYRLNKRATFSLALENLLDENYRLHGSGQNEPGFNVVGALRLDF